MSSATMSLSRAFTFTTRLRRSDSSSKDSVMRSNTVSKGKPIDRSQISSPVALLSTTNVLSYNAPDISSIRQVRKTSSSISSASSRHSDRDSDAASSQRSRDTFLTDASSVNSSPTSPRPREFSSHAQRKPSPRRAASTSDMRGSARSSSLDRSPEIPQRAPSHSKHSHEQKIARQRSLQQFSTQLKGTSSASRPIGTIREQRTSVDFFNGKIDAAHPFGKELEQLDEVAEEFGGTIRDAEREADLAVMRERGLKRFCADDYMLEIKPLLADIFQPQAQQSVVWI